MYSTPGISQSSFSIGLVTRSSTSLRRSAGHLHEDVDHRHDDLRLFLARQLPHREGAEQQRAADDQQRRQLGGDPRVGEPPGGTEAAWRRSLPDLHAGAVRQAGGHRADHLLALAQSGEHFHGVGCALAGGDQARARHAVFDHEDRLQLPALDHAPRRERPAPCARPAGTTRGRTCRSADCGSAGRSIFTM